MIEQAEFRLVLVDAVRALGVAAVKRVAAGAEFLAGRDTEVQALSYKCIRYRSPLRKTL